MPSASPELRAQWPGGDEEAIDYLKSQGYTLLRSWHWLRPEPGRAPTEREASAICYLADEWDFGGLVVPREASPPGVMVEDGRPSHPLGAVVRPSVGEAALDEER